MPGFLMDTQRGAGRLYFNPALADTPQGTEVSFWLATDDGPLQVTLAPQESVAFIPTSQVPRVMSLLRTENGYRLKSLQLQDFHRHPVSGLYCRAHRQLMRLENCCAKTQSPSMRAMYAHLSGI